MVERIARQLVRGLEIKRRSSARREGGGELHNYGRGGSCVV